MKDLVDFVTSGWQAGLGPHPLLDVGFYAAQLAEGLGGSDPITHYRHRGAAAGLDPHPLFDTRFYLEQRPEALGAGIDPLTHYLGPGWQDGADPHPVFSTTHYRRCNPDVAAAGVNPLLHYVTVGAAENRPVSPFFDGAEYLRRNPDVAASGLPGLLHFVLYGAAERRVGSALLALRVRQHPAYDRPGGAIDFARDDRESYLAWVRVSRRLPAGWRARAVAEIAGFRHRPVVSLLLHVTEGSGGALWETIQSLQGQAYGEWQACAVVDPTVAPGVRERLVGWAKVDGRIHVLDRGTSEEPAFALNAALDGARGRFVGLLDPGDRLHALALCALVGGLQGGRGQDLVYGDEDRLDAAGFHVDPVFKPDWSPDLLLGMDTLSRSCLWRTQLVREVGGFRAGFGGAAEYDLALRLRDRLEPGTAVHVARPLYHRHGRGEVGDARHDGMQRALRAYLGGSRGAVIGRGRVAGRFRVGFEPQMEGGAEPLVSVVIPTGDASFPGPRGRERVLDTCLRSLRRGTAWPALEIVVVHDPAMGAARRAALARGGAVLVADGGLGFNFSRKINLGVAASRGAYVLLLNDDVEAKRPDWLRQMLGWVQQPGVGVAGAKLFFADGRLQHTGIVVQHGNPGHLYYRGDGEDPGYLDMNAMPRNWLAVTGACQLMRRSTFDAAGGYDEGLPLNFNDVDFCLRVGALGLRCVQVAQAELYHFEGSTRAEAGREQAPEAAETRRFQAQWLTRYPIDPYYHPDLPCWAPLGARRAEEVRGTASQARPATLRTGLEGVNWLGPVNRSSGLGTASRGYVAALQAAGLATRLVPLDRVYPHQTIVSHGFSSRMQDFPVTLVHANADTTGVVLEHYGAEFGRARYRIGVWVWELPAARPEWQETARRYDEIWVPSTFCEAAFRGITDVPVTVVPYALQGLPRFGRGDRAGVRAGLGVAEGAFVFLYMFDTFSFVDRKNPGALLDAFEAEFGGDEQAVLVLKISYFGNLSTGYSGGNEALLLRLEDVRSRCRNIRVVTEILPQAGVYGLIDAADCYVSPHRSEGFGLTVLEAMAYGKVVIATDFGGTTDYVRAGVGLPLDYTLVELAEDMGPYGRGNVWAEPSVSHLRGLMRRVVEDAGLCAGLGRAAREHVVGRFSAASVGALARRRLGVILNSEGGGVGL